MKQMTAVLRNGESTYDLICSLYVPQVGKYVMVVAVVRTNIKQIILNHRLQSHTPWARLNKAPAMLIIAAAMEISDTGLCSSRTLIKFGAFD